MSGNPFSQLANWADHLNQTCRQAVADNKSRKTVIVHPQLSNNLEEVQKLAEDWKSREEKQLMDNIRRALG